MKVVLIRHGEPDYSYCISNGFFGMALNLAALSSQGIKQAEEVSCNHLLDNSECVISSPYTRALQTAAIFSRNLNLPMVVENDLHEWIPDLCYTNTKEQEEDYSREFLDNNGKWPNGESRRWENIDMFSNRILESLRKYLGRYEKIVVVTHAAVIYHLTGSGSIPFCGLEEIEFTRGYKPNGWFRQDNKGN